MAGCYVYGNVMSLVTLSGADCRTEASCSHAGARLLWRYVPGLHRSDRRTGASCYYQMFYGCTSLKTLTCLATARTANNALSNWVYNVPEGGTFYKAAGAEWTSDTSGIPVGWQVKDYSGD